jgi:FtsP/CotA-like multicopper oxidase with cupredoxin domain
LGHDHGITGPQNIDGPGGWRGPGRAGQTYPYAWTVSKTPEIGMYHPHFDAVSRVPDGMAGAFVVGAMVLPAQATAQGAVQSAVHDQVLFLNDGGTIGLSLNGKSLPTTAPFVATQGQWIASDLLQREPDDPPNAPARDPADDSSPVTGSRSPTPRWTAPSRWRLASG